MKLPKKLKIGGHTYKVDYSKVLDNKMGETDFDNCIINISKDMVQSQKEATLIHEIFHALNTTIGETQLGHSLLDSLSEQFYQALSDNNLLK